MLGAKPEDVLCCAAVMLRLHTAAYNQEDSEHPVWAIKDKYREDRWHAVGPLLQRSFLVQVSGSIWEDPDVLRACTLSARSQRSHSRLARVLHLLDTLMRISAGYPYMKARGSPDLL